MLFCTRSNQKKTAQLWRRRVLFFQLAYFFFPAMFALLTLLARFSQAFPVCRAGRSQQPLRQSAYRLACCSRSSELIDTLPSGQKSCQTVQTKNVTTVRALRGFPLKHPAQRPYCVFVLQARRRNGASHFQVNDDFVEWPASFFLLSVGPPDVVVVFVCKQDRQQGKSQPDEVWRIRLTCAMIICFDFVRILRSVLAAHACRVIRNVNIWDSQGQQMGRL